MKENFKDEKDIIETTEVKKVSDDQLSELIKIGKKQLFYQKVATSCIAGMLVVMIIAVAVLIPRFSVKTLTSSPACVDVSTMFCSLSSCFQNFFRKSTVPRFRCGFPFHKQWKKQERACRIAAVCQRMCTRKAAVP